MFYNLTIIFCYFHSRFVIISVPLNTLRYVDFKTEQIYIGQENKSAAFLTSKFLVDVANKSETDYMIDRSETADQNVR